MEPDVHGHCLNLINSNIPMSAMSERKPVVYPAEKNPSASGGFAGMTGKILRAAFYLSMCLALLLQADFGEAKTTDQAASKTAGKANGQAVATPKQKLAPSKKAAQKIRTNSKAKIAAAPANGKKVNDKNAPAAANKKNVTPKTAASAELPMLWPPVLWPEDGCTMHRLPGEPDNNGPVILVVGGIQGDEPGGFSAASLLVTNYKITKGQVWVVPSLNLPSMVSRNRGVYGDMNRKFANISQNDPDLAVVSRIKELILHPRVSLILNLHDGSGFYSPKDEGPRRNPRRWGQSLIIDQANLSGPGSTNLEQMGNNALAHANANLVSPDHRLNLHNTRTSDGDKEMEKTLSYFAVRNGKPAFGLEASKDFTTEYRAYYHLLMIESLLSQSGVEFKRNFPLDPQGVLQALNNGVSLAMWDNRVVLPLENVRKSIAMLPMKKGLEFSAKPSKPIMTVLRGQGGYQVLYGNRLLTQVKPLFLDFDTSLKEVELVVDGKTRSAHMGDVISVGSDFVVPEIKGFRVNAIGAQRGDPKRDGCESDIKLAKRDFLPDYSVDNSASLYRVELYKGDAFAGMVLVQFGQPGSQEQTATGNQSGPQNDRVAGSGGASGTPVINEALSEKKGRESSLGF